MVGIDLGEHDPALRMGHRVTLAARRRGALVRPLGDTVVLVPPLSISAEDLERLLTITAESIAAACASGPGRCRSRTQPVSPTLLRARSRYSAL